MPRIRLTFAVASVPLILVRCDPAAKPPAPASTRVEASKLGDARPASASNDTVQIGDPDAEPRDAPRPAFVTEELRAARALLEARLAKDQFTSTDSAHYYRYPCRNQIVRASRPEVIFAFVRPRVLSVSPEDSGATERTFSVEVTRLAVMRLDLSGRVSEVVGVTRDTLMWKLQAEGDTANLAVCGFPGHPNRSSDANGMYARLSEAWLPINAGNTDIRRGITWDGGMSWDKLRHLADSVSKLPVDFVVEGNPEPELPIYYPDLCPGEGCEFGKWLACDTVRVLKDQRVGSPTSFIAHRNDTLSVPTGNVKITQAGKVVFNRVVKVDEEGTHAVFTPGDTLYPLIHTGEGFGSWYFRGKEGGGFFFFGTIDNTAEIGIPSHEGFDVVRQAKHEWSVKARNKKGQEGWFQPLGHMPGMSPHYEEGPLSCGADEP